MHVENKMHWNTLNHNSGLWYKMVLKNSSTAFWIKKNMAFNIYHIQATNIWSCCSAAKYHYGKNIIKSNCSSQYFSKQLIKAIDHSVDDNNDDNGDGNDGG